ncbi:peptidylprolyl isomerase [Lentibacillus sediminis]|uniref:peptidylprolyl isomerase n=1 Tax=Lentibacillus sediminis TaxID=1940529 RepID=UPI000C1BEDB3|nr:peptidyl-prolyl cis-trans isomerase [Lentibacillus sediminis]
MSKKLLLGIILVLVVSNLATLMLWNNNSGESVVLNDDQEGTALDTREAVASVNGEEVTYDEWMQALRSNHGEKLLKSMIDRSVVSQLAEEKNIEIIEKVIDREVALLTSMQGVMSEEAYQEKEEQWREDVRYRYQLQQLLTEDINIPEEEIRTYYDNYGNQYDFSAAMQISHIVVEDMETAEKIVDELDQGAHFSMLAQEYSIDEESQSDGYLGFINTNSQFFPSGYEEIAADMEEHSYSEPFQSDAGGIAILYVHRKLPAIEFTYEEMRPYVKSELALQESDQSLTAAPLWEEFDIGWIYDGEVAR